MSLSEQDQVEQLEASVRYWQEAWMRTSLRTIYHPALVGYWMTAQSPRLDGRRPVDLLGTPDFDKVVEVVDQLVSGGNG